MSSDEGALAGPLAGLCEELRASLGRMEALQRLWGDPLDERGALRRALRAEMRAERGAPELGGARAGAAAAHVLISPESAPAKSSLLTLSPTFTAASSGRSLEQELSQLSSCGSRSRLPQLKSWRHRPKNTWRDTWRSEHSASSELPPQPSSPIGWARLALWTLAHRHGKAFDAAVGLLIVASSISVGVEIQCDLEGRADCSKVTHDLEHFFLVAFILELIIRASADGLSCWRRGWFRFDTVLVAVGVISSWVVEPIVLNIVDDDGGVVFDTLSLVLVLRLLRLIRLVRALRLFQQFQEMWKIANGFLAAFRTVLSACLLILLTVYVFACLAIELITRNSSLRQDPVTAQVIHTHFPSLQVTMLTLVQFANTDSIAAVYKPIVERAWHLVFFFGLVWLIVTIMAWNLITALIVDAAIVQGDSDREFELAMKRKRLRALEPIMKALFQELDKRGNGHLSLSEFRSGLESMEATTMKHLPADLRNILESDQLIEVCECLDSDGSGAIDETEFIDGIFSLVLQSVPIETTQMLQLLRTQSDVLQRIQRKLPAVVHRSQH